MMLEKAGHDVWEAANGIEALESYRLQPADLAIIDIIMPEKEGIETIMDLRRKYPDTKIIAISGTGLESPFLIMSKHLGADYIIDKPFTEKEIMGGIEEIMEV